MRSYISFWVSMCNSLVGVSMLASVSVGYTKQCQLMIPAHFLIHLLERIYSEVTLKHKIFFTFIQKLKKKLLSTSPKRHGALQRQIFSLIHIFKHILLTSVFNTNRFYHFNFIVLFSMAKKLLITLEIIKKKVSIYFF